MAGTFTQVTDAAGNVSYVPVISKPNAAAKWTGDRVGETSTHIGAAVLAVSYPAIVQGIVTAVALGFAGDYIGAAQNGIPAVIGLAGAISAIIRPDRGPTNEQIQTAVSAMSRDDLIKLLTPAVPPSTTAS